ncbi:hypothetical protein [Candidatus Clavichlamydia salmonicola]|uniref:hypothetical protein n=1 Tax=Candidatus Clavichlamydia salmonicola TaxID=469812 RepID=UPI0018918745|nr:hypothetical protein [Candidatus Clavichlamydia salmonicola]
MKFLLVDTASFSPSFTFIKDDEPEHIFFLQATGRGTEELSACFLQEIEKYPEFMPEKLSGIGVVAGPGPFIALRTGMMFARGLAFSLNIPLIGVSTFSAFIPSQEGSFAVVMENGTQGAFISFGYHNIDNTVFNGSPCFYAKDELKKILISKKITQVVSMGGSRVKEWLEDNFFLETVKPNIKIWKAELFKQFISKSTGSIIQPFYLRKSL